MKARTFKDIFKFNPYHDSRGRFASANGAASFTYAPGKSKAHDSAIQREKERKATAGAVGGKQKELTPEDKDWVNTKQQSGHNYASRTYTQKDVDRLATYTETDQATAKKMLKSVETFIDHGCTNIRKAQMETRDGKPSNAKDKEDADNIEMLIQRAPKWAGGNLHRGINVSTDTADEIMKKVQAGEELDMRGVSSWSSEAKIAGDFAYTSFKGRVGVVFHTNGKSTSKGTSIKHLSDLPHENEVLMSQDARYKGTRIVKNATKNLIEIYVDEV